MFLNSIGMMGELVVLGWLTLELTNSPFLVGVAMGMRSIPLFFVGVLAGVLADRLPRHRVLIVTGIGQAMTAATIGVLTMFGVVRLSHVLLMTFAAGMIRGVEQASRQSYTHDVVGASRLMSALALLGVAMRGGWLLGSLEAGSMIAHFGSGSAYLAVSASYLVGALVLIPAAAPAGTSPAVTGSLWQNVLGFVTSLGRERVLLVLMILTGGAEMLGFSHQVVLPSLARDVLHVGPEGLGVMNAARSLGGIIGLFAVSSSGPPARGAGTFFLAVLVAFGVSLIVLGGTPSLVGFGGVVLVLVVVNGIGALTDLMAQSLMQLSVPSGHRGRAGGAWVVAIGLGPLGQLQIGALASAFSVSVALGASGLALATLGIVAALLSPRVRRI